MDQLPRAVSVGRHKFDASRRGKKYLKYCCVFIPEINVAIKTQPGTNRSRKGGKRACYVTPDLNDDKEGESEKGRR